jgi:hypothetical protein
MSSAAEPLFSASQKDTEGLILANEETEQSFVVDCPALHIIPASALDIGSVPRGTPVWLSILLHLWISFLTVFSLGRFTISWVVQILSTLSEL